MKILMKKKFSALASVRVSKMLALRILFVLILFAPHVAFAQDLRIAIVDVEKISNQSLAGKSIQSQLKEKRSAFQKEFSSRENNLMSSEKTLIEEKNTLSSEEFAEKRKEFEAQLLETKNLFQKRRSSLDKGMNTALSDLRKTIIEVTAEIAEKENFNIVLGRDSVVIVETEMDITDKVMAAMNKKLPKIKLQVAK